MFFFIDENKILDIFIKLIKLVLLIIIFANSFQNIYNQSKKDVNYEISDLGDFSFFSYIDNITDIKGIYFIISNINYYYSLVHDLIEFQFYIHLYGPNSHLIKPSELTLKYNLHILCTLYIYENNENIYSIANIYKNKFFLCVEHVKISEQVKFGINFYKINEIDEKIEYNEQYFLTDKIININLDSKLINNNLFNINYLYYRYNKLLSKIKKSKNKNCIKEQNSLKSFFLKPPLLSLKREISLVEGRWYYNNIFGTLFCFCKGIFCLNINKFMNNNYQYCKYYFYLTLLDSHRNLYSKSHYLFADFFEENIESADAFPIFEAMKKENLNVHYLTISQKIYNDFYLNNTHSNNGMDIIYGIKNINGDVLEKYFELILRLKVVITAEQFKGIDNLFYNIEYITFIFLGHGVTYIKSFLYNNYLSYSKYNKILLPNCEKFVNLAIEAGWKDEDIIKIGYPRWDKYEIYNKNTLKNNINQEKSIFLMFTWRKVKNGKKISDLYFSNIYNILNDKNINYILLKNNIKIFFCYHHKVNKKIKLYKKKNIRVLNQTNISNLLRNCSLLVTDFSSIIFDAIIQKKPFISYIPDGLDSNLKDIYSDEYYETITKLKSGQIYLYEVFFKLEEVIKKIIYYINTDFVLEKEKMNFYNGFRLERGNNTKKFIQYIEKIN